VIVAFGDSLTAGFGTEPDQNFPAYLQQYLAHDGYHYRVVNLGVSGNTTKDGLARVKDVLALHPVLVIVSLGGNDGLRGSPVSEMRSNLDTILADISQTHVPIVIGGITLPPNYGAAYVQQFNAVYPALAAKYHAALLPFMLQGVWDHPEFMQDDGIHPKSEGYVFVAKNFLPLVEPLLKKN
jgi:acyl-CoA thioesterase-1